MGWFFNEEKYEETKQAEKQEAHEKGQEDWPETYQEPYPSEVWAPWPVSDYKKEVNASYRAGVKNKDDQLKGKAGPK